MTGSHKNNVPLSAFLLVISLFLEHCVPGCCYLIQFYCLSVCHSILHSHKTLFKTYNAVKYMGHGVYVYGMVCMYMAWCVCMWNGVYIYGMVCMYMAWCVCIWHGVYVYGMLCMYMAWCVCIWHGVYVYDMSIPSLIVRVNLSFHNEFE